MTPGDEPEISILDARLAEIDRRLHSIQTGLGEDEPRARAPRPTPSMAVRGDSLRAGPPPLPSLPPDAPPRLPPPDAHSAAELLIRLREVTAEQEDLLASMRQLLGTLQRVATVPAPASHVPTTPAPATPAASAGAASAGAASAGAASAGAASAGAASAGAASAGAGAGSAVSLSAGPFASTAALHAFRATLEALPGVRRVELRGFEGVDRAVLEVHL